MKRDDFTLPLDLGRELIIDNFAGGGGTSTGLEQAFGRPVDIAINHDPEALAMHAINHPHTKHLCESVWDVDPIEVTGNQPVALVWLSPDCKHFSKAKGGTPVAKHIRGLAWVGMRWIAKTKPRVLMLENVEEFQEWGPLIIDADGSARPDPAKKGKTFESFVRQIRGHGYAVDWKELRACDAGAPTIRKRLFLIARRDRLPIVWPDATHGAPTDKAVLAGNLLPWRTAAECIDFTLPAQSLWGRSKELADNTQRRVAKGLWRHVLTSASPFIVGVGGRMGQSPARSVEAPAQTITSKADSCLAQPVLTPFIADQSRPAEGRTAAANEPLRTACAEVKGGHFTVVGAYMINTRNGERPGQDPRVRSANEPYWTVTGLGSQGAIASACLEQANGGFNAENDGRAANEPFSTVMSRGANQRLITAYCVKYYSNGGQSSDLFDPMHTVPTKGRMGLVKVEQVSAACLDPEHVDRARRCAELLHRYLPEHFEQPAEMVLVWQQSQWWVLVDITLRMLKPRELFNAQGFPADYVIDEIPDPALLFKDGVQAAAPLSLQRRPLTATAQVRMCGNSVSPPQARALVAANFAHELGIYREAA